MIPQNPLAMQVQNENDSWQQQLANAISSASQLLGALELPKDYLNAGTLGAQDFAVRVPLSYLSRIEKGNIHDPLLRQIWPLADETAPPPNGYVLDPLGEAHSNTTPGIVHKYKSRVLLICNGSCAINCRYCFRRHFPYSDNNLSSRQWADAMSYIEQRSEINEVILSGGDPLTNNDKRLFGFIEAIENIPHITRIRIHTRLPIVIPDRITPALITRLQSSRLRVIMVVHCNHANEIDETVATCLSGLFKAGIHVLNQSVLLKGVNDNHQALHDLSEALFACHALPYYLHLLDPIIGAHHFDVPKATAQNLMLALQNSLPGFLVPKLVQEIRGRSSKTLIATPITPVST